MEYRRTGEYGGHVRGKFSVIVEADSESEALNNAPESDGIEFTELRNDTEIDWDYAEVTKI